MNNKSEAMPGSRSNAVTIIGWLFGTIVTGIGLLNLFWGNDQGFGIFLVLLSLVYIPPANLWLRNRFGRSIPVIVKLLLALFIIWAAVGVGELFIKIDMMVNDI